MAERMLGKYQIRRELGKGAMGIVYEGFDPLIERTVAIKTIRPEQLNQSQAAEILARFRREAQAAGRLNHPHIVGIYEYGEDAEPGAARRIAYIAMEFVKGRELRRLLRSERALSAEGQSCASWARSSMRSSTRTSAASSTAT